MSDVSFARAGFLGQCLFIFFLNLPLIYPEVVTVFTLIGASYLWWQGYTTLWSVVPWIIFLWVALRYLVLRTSFRERDKEAQMWEQGWLEMRNKHNKLKDKYEPDEPTILSDT